MHSDAGFLRPHFEVQNNISDNDKTKILKCLYPMHNKHNSFLKMNTWNKTMLANFESLDKNKSAYSVTHSILL